MFNVTFKEDLNELGQLFITLNLGVGFPNLSIFNTLFIKGEEVRKKITK